MLLPFLGVGDDDENHKNTAKLPCKKNAISKRTYSNGGLLNKQTNKQLIIEYHQQIHCFVYIRSLDRSVACVCPICAFIFLLENVMKIVENKNKSIGCYFHYDISYIEIYHFWVGW